MVQTNEEGSGFEHVKVVFNGERFDELVHLGLPQGDDVEVAFKDHATIGGDPGAVISFTVWLPGGGTARAQALVTGRLFLAIAAAVHGRYPGLEF